jgi:hypothetical protein
MQSFRQREKAAQKRVDATYSDYRTAGGSIDLLLRARISLAQAQIAYQRSITEYNKAITEIHYRKGTLFEYNAVRIHNVHPPQPKAPGRPAVPEIPPRRPPERAPPRRSPMALDDRRPTPRPQPASASAAPTEPPSFGPDSPGLPAFDREFDYFPLREAAAPSPPPDADPPADAPLQKIPARKKPQPADALFVPARRAP